MVWQSLLKHLDLVYNSQVAQWERIHLSMQETQEMQVWPLGWGDPLEEEMATHSRILTWKIPWTEEPGGLQFMGLQRVGHDWAHMHWYTTIFFSFYYAYPRNNLANAIKGTRLGDVWEHALKDCSNTLLIILARIYSSVYSKACMNSFCNIPFSIQ